MRIDIIGGSGFIGTRLSNRLRSRDGAVVKIIDRQPSATHPDLTLHADVRSLVDLRNTIGQGSVIINLAAEHRDDVKPRSLYHDVNVEGARNICRAAREKDTKKIIFTSSVAVYGFAPLGTNEQGAINPFNDYGKTKFSAEEVFREWQAEKPRERSLVVVRPTVVFGERNRGNVYNLLKQIASGRFIMIGTGNNRKSMAYVENVAAFLEHAINLPPGSHTYNYIDKPDFSMNELVATVRKCLNQSTNYSRIPYWLGYSIGVLVDGIAAITQRKFAVSAIRVRKFCSDSVYSSSVSATTFHAPIPLEEAIRKTIHHEFLEKSTQGPIFFSE